MSQFSVKATGDTNAHKVAHRVYGNSEKALTCSPMNPSSHLNEKSKYHVKCSF